MESNDFQSGPHGAAGHLNAQEPPRDGRAEQKTSGAVFVVGVILNDKCLFSCFADFRDADVAFDHAFQGVLCEFEFACKQMGAGEGEILFGKHHHFNTL